MYRTTPGLRHVEADLPLLPAPDEGGPIGIVADRLEAVAEYLDAGGRLLAGYVVIRDARDVPERLGGIASLTDAWPDGLAEELARACGLAGDAL